MKKEKINIENYEAYLLDYMEGNLSKEDTTLLLEFVVLHPELNINLNELEPVVLMDESIAFENKSELKRTAGQLVSDEQFVSYIENTLSTGEKKRIEKLSATHPEIEKELNLYKKTILIPDATIVFGNKKVLKKETKVIYLYSRQTLSIAAAILLLIGFVILFNYFGSDDTQTQVSENKTVPVNKQKNAVENNNPIQENSVKIVTPAIKNNSPLAKNTSQLISAHQKAIIVNTVALNSTATNSINNPVTNQTEMDIQPILASNSNTITVPVLNELKNNNSFVITEKAFDEDEKTAVASVENKSIWQKARKAIRGLNKMGVKAVNATETTNTNSEQYLVTLGNFSIEKNKYNQE